VVQGMADGRRMGKEWPRKKRMNPFVNYDVENEREQLEGF